MTSRRVINPIFSPPAAGRRQSPGKPYREAMAFAGRWSLAGKGWIMKEMSARRVAVSGPRGCSVGVKWSNTKPNPLLISLVIIHRQQNGKWLYFSGSLLRDAPNAHIDHN
jgi:hypothetical protein